ncbi:LCP family protein [Nocardioides ferulae]|uniref:LCP family protein n=1 Tax=Nocardioides ferulae TaxID=2340821 RepID=UPI001F0C45FC|nr:LCP family protein [Nocardioides ferulae]
MLLSSLLVLGMVTGLSVVFIYRHLNGNLTVVDLADQLHDRPEKQGRELPQEPLNILVMGSDTRDCEGCDIDQEGTGSGFSDTTILMHLSADRERAYGISIPRDSLVDRPECEAEDGSTIPAESGAMWNAAYQLGGPACTIQQFEQLTDVFVDHYIVVNFQGFQDMVDAIDGVEVCIPEDIEDPAHGINIPAGTREIEGKEALNYVRARYTLGDGSDLSRIKRQQAFIAAMAKKVISSGTVARLDRLVGFLNAATNSLTVDPGLENVYRIGKLGLGFQNIGLDNIQFLTVPWQYSPADPNRVEWLPEADALWEKLIADEPLTRRLTSEAISAGNVPGSGNPSSGSGSESPSGSPSSGAEDDERAQALEQAGLCA